MFRRTPLFAALLLVTQAIAGAQAPVSEPATEPVRITTEWSADGVVPGGQILLAVVLDISEPWHLQLNKPELEWLSKTEVSLENLPANVIYGDIQYPQPHPIQVDFGQGLQTLHFYTGRSVVFIKVSVGKGVEPGDYPLELATHWQACDDKTCLQPQVTRQPVVLRVVPPGAPVSPLNSELFKAYAAGSAPAQETLRIPFFGLDFDIDPKNLFVLLSVAAIGGFLLNLTPCVLPLIPIKVLSLSQAAGNRRRCFLLGLVMSLGVVAFWLGLGVAIASVAGFTSTNQLFQYPWFTITVGVVIAGMALGMLGLFAVGLPQWVYAINPGHDTLHGSFGFGVMTAVLSTPCTAPFMGAAAAWAATRPAPVTLSTFAAIGVGMATPYLLLSAFPGLVDKMPRTGPASELIKQVMGLLMLAAAAYFLGAGIAGMTVDPPDPPSNMYWWAVAASILAAGAWLAWRTLQITRSTARRVIFVGVGALFIAAAALIGIRFTDEGPIDWTYYTPERLAAAQAENKVVVLEFTAQWCLNCKVLEQTVLHSDRVVEQLQRTDVAAIKVDITGNNKLGDAKLRESGRRSIPLLVVYDRQGNEVFKSDAYTADQVVQAIQTASSQTAVSRSISAL